MTTTIYTSLHQLQEPTTEPLTVAEVREHLRLVPSGSPATHPDDALLEALIMAARQHFDGKEGSLGRCLLTQQWEMTLDRFPETDIRIPLPPLKTVDAILYDDENGDEQTVSATTYIVDTVSEPGWVVLAHGERWPTTLQGANTVRVQFTAGYGDTAADLPQPILVAMKVLLAYLYQNREGSAPIPPAIDGIVQGYRIWEFT